jgi:hypothetical protein
MSYPQSTETTSRSAVRTVDPDRVHGHHHLEDHHWSNYATVVVYRHTGEVPDRDQQPRHASSDSNPSAVAVA